MGTPVSLRFIFPKVPSLTFFPDPSKFITSAAAPLVSTRVVRNRGMMKVIVGFHEAAQKCMAEFSGDRKGTSGVSTNGVTANFMWFDRGTFWVLLLTYFYIPKSARACLFPSSVKISRLYSGPISVDLFCPQPRLASAISISNSIIVDISNK